MVDGELCLSASPQVEITVTNERTGESISLTHFNKWRNSSGGLYLFNEDFSTVSTHTESAGGADDPHGGLRGGSGHSPHRQQHPSPWR